MPYKKPYDDTDTLNRISGRFAPIRIEARMTHALPRAMTQHAKTGLAFERILRYCV